MTDDNEPIWSKIRIRQPIEDIIKHGPSIEVTVSAIDREPRIKALAQIDTGAAGTGISRPLVAKLKLEPIGWGEIHHPGLPPIVAPIFRVRIALPSGDIEINVMGLTTLDSPHDVLIGRDVLSCCRLSVDFTDGTTTIHIRIAP